MRALVVYESMFGGTRALAEAIAGALDRGGMPATLVAAAAAPSSTADYGLLVVGAPTHAHTLPQASSRREAAAWSADPSKALTLDVSAHSIGVREWLKSLEIADPAPRVAAFSTRVDIARILAGDAAESIAKRFRSRGIRHIEQECFLVSASSKLLEGELLRAGEWAEKLPALVAAAV
jgi:menaquinone-dependent protoporphyrinogen IX oxidase